MLQRLVAELLPGARLSRVRELRGGLGSLMQVIEAVSPEGTPQRFVLRRNLTKADPGMTQLAQREFKTLEVLQESSVPAPQPLLLDDHGERFGTPAMALSYIPGRVILEPSSPDRWLRGAAEALLGVHKLTPERHDLSHLDRQDREYIRRKLIAAPEAGLAENAVARQVASTLRDTFERIEWLPLCLVHDDYWPGNVVWYRGRVSGVIDWTFAAIGDARDDVAQYRLDLALMHGIEMSDVFLDAYNAASPAPLTGVWFFDLLRGLSAMRALSVYEKWLKGYHDLGLTQITPELADARLRAFIRRALSQASERS